MKLSMNFSRKALALLLALVMLITALSVNLAVMAGADTGGFSPPPQGGGQGGPDSQAEPARHPIPISLRPPISWPICCSTM